MKKIVFVFSLVFLIFSCKNDKNKSQNSDGNIDLHTIDNLPEGEWNGEYIKIKDEDEGERIKKQSLGSEFYSMGTVKFNLGTDSIDFKLFEKRKNNLTFSETTINAIITSASGDIIKVKFFKNKIIDNHKGNYKAANEATKNQTVSMTLTTQENDTETLYNLSKGTIEILEFNPRLATLEFKMNGTFSTTNGIEKEATGIVDLHFEEAIMIVDGF